MEPFTITLLMLFVLLSGGGAGAALSARRKKEQKRRLREAIRVREQVLDAEVSIFDVFWDLGVSDFALEIMGNQGLLMDDVQDLHFALDALADRVAEHGSYATFVRENLEAIQEFYREHKRAGDRRSLPALENKARKTLPLPAVGSDDTGEVRGTGNLPVPYHGTGRHLPVVAASPEDRMQVREGLGGNIHALQMSAAEIDVDEVARVDPMQLLGGIFDGTIGSQLERWWEMRDLRGLRNELDRELQALYRYYAQEANGTPNFFGHLYDTARRWDAEAGRIQDLLDKEPWDGRSWAVCAEVLTVEALAVARKLAYAARQNVRSTIEHIHGRARAGNTAMAGYLVYLNHHALFAGRSPQYGEHVRRVESATYKVQRELRELMQKGVI